MDNAHLQTNGQLGILALESCRDLGDKVNNYIKKKRASSLSSDSCNEQISDKSYLIPIDEVRFANGEGKVKIEETVRGKDIYILCDIANYCCTYEMFGFKNHKGPDEHSQDIKRVVSAIGGKTRRVTVIIPILHFQGL